MAAAAGRARLIRLGLATAVTVAMVAPQSALADAGLKVLGKFGDSITKEQLFSGVLTGAWIVAKPAATEELKSVLNRPGDYSAYNIDADLGSVVDVRVADVRPDGLRLEMILERSRVRADFTQPFVGQWGDPTVEIAWDSRFVVDVRYTFGATCPGVQLPLPDLVFETITFEMGDPEIDVKSTVADVVSGVIGFVASGGNIAIAIGTSLGVGVAVDEVASGAVPTGAMDLTEAANEELDAAFSPCELVRGFAGLMPAPFRTLSASPDLVVVGVDQVPSLAPVLSTLGAARSR